MERAGIIDRIREAVRAANERVESLARVPGVRLTARWLLLWAFGTAMAEVMLHPVRRNLAGTLWQPSFWAAFALPTLVASALVDRFIAPPARVADLVARLGHKAATVRHKAEDELFALGPEAVDILSDALLRNSRYRRLLTAFYFAALCFFGPVEWIRHGFSVRELELTFYPLLPLMSLSLGSKLVRSSANVLSCLDDVRAVSLLLEMRKNIFVREQADRGLVRLLPRLRPSDALTDTDHRNLAQACSSLDATIAIAALKALAQIGDERDITALEVLCERPISARWPKERREEAGDILAAVREKGRLAEAERTLLRPAAAVAQDGLLRPAAGGGAADDELLRPAG